MRLTKEIIELSIQLHKLGYKQKIQIGDWLCSGKPGLCTYCTSAYVFTEWNEYQRGKVYPIPSLEDAFLFLKEHGFVDFTIVDLMEKYLVHSDNDNGLFCGEGKTIHEAMLNFMIETLEIENAKI